MEKERKSEEKPMSASSADQSPPTDDASSSVKRLYAGLKHNVLESPSSSSSPRLRNPSLSICHVCDSRIKGKERLRTLDSQWRIVLLCKVCFTNVQSAKICSYCFQDMSELAFSCCHCKRRVHRGCSNNIWSDLNSGSDLFTCIDCWVPRSPNGVNRSRKRKSSDKTLFKSDSTKVAGTVSESRALEDAVKDASSTVEVKISAAVRAKEKALKKAVLARKAAENAANALDLAVVAAREETKVKGSNASAVDDAELALRLHRAINSSARIMKSLSSMKINGFDDEKMSKSDGFSLTKKSDTENQMVCEGTEVCNDNAVLVNSDKTDKLDMAVNAIESKGHGQDCIKITTYKRRFKTGGCKGSSTLELSVKEEQASCSNKVTNSSETCCSIYSGSQSACGQDIPILEKKNGPGLNRFLKKYSRKCRGTESAEKCLRKYTRRHTSLKPTLNRKTEFLLKNIPLDSRVSVPGLPLLQMDCSQMSTFSSFPLRAHLPSGGLSQS